MRPAKTKRQTAGGLSFKYRLVGEQSHVMRNGRGITLYEYEGHCAVCGSRFVQAVALGSKAQHLLRTCEFHRGARRRTYYSAQAGRAEAAEPRAETNPVETPRRRKLRLTPGQKRERQDAKRLQATQKRMMPRIPGVHYLFREPEPGEDRGRRAVAELHAAMHSEAHALGVRLTRMAADHYIGMLEQPPMDGRRFAIIHDSPPQDTGRSLGPTVFDDTRLEAAFQDAGAVVILPRGPLRKFYAEMMRGAASGRAGIVVETREQHMVEWARYARRIVPGAVVKIVRPEAVRPRGVPPRSPRATPARRAQSDRLLTAEDLLS